MPQVGAPDPVTTDVPTPYDVHGRDARDAIAYSSRSEVTTIFVSGARAVELPAHLLRQAAEVAGVEAHGAEPGAGHLDGGRHAAFRRRTCRPAAWCRAPTTATCAANASRSVVQQRERVRGRADGRQPVPPPASRLDVPAKPAMYGGPGGGDRCLLVRPARAHLQHGRSPAALVMRDAADATAESKFRIERSSVSSRTASAKVPSTSSTGEPGKNTSPSRSPGSCRRTGSPPGSRASGVDDAVLARGRPARHPRRRKSWQRFETRPVPARTP